MGAIHEKKPSLVESRSLSITHGWSQEDEFRQKELMERIAKLCESNENAYLVIIGKMEGLSKSEILELLDEDEKKYNSAIRLIRRHYDSIIKELEK